MEVLTSFAEALARGQCPNLDAITFHNCYTSRRNDGLRLGEAVERVGVIIRGKPAEVTSDAITWS